MPLQSLAHWIHSIEQAPAMAATNFRSLILILYFALVQSGTLLYFSLTPLSKDNNYCYHRWSCTGYKGSFFTKFLISSRPSVVQRALSSRGFCRTRVSLSKWTKHGYLSLLIPGHDPPLDLTVYKDVLKNPGPESFENVLLRRNSNLHTSYSTTTTYSRAELLGIRRSVNCSLDSSIIPVLKSLGIFRYRGSRGGQRSSQRKIPVVISYRPGISCFSASMSRTLVDVCQPTIKGTTQIMLPKCKIIEE